MSKNGIKGLQSVTEWDKVANMVNRFGLPVKNYYRPTPPLTRVSYTDSVLTAVLGGLRVLERFLTEKKSVPRRVSAFDR